MAAITVNNDQIEPIFPKDAEIFDFIGEASLNYGIPIRISTSGGIVGASAAAAGTANVRGITVSKGGAGQGISVLKKGHVAGLNVSGLAYDAPIYLGDTAGTFADTAGTVSVVVGRVVPMSDSNKTKVVYFNFNWV